MRFTVTREEAETLRLALDAAWDRCSEQSELCDCTKLGGTQCADCEAAALQADAFSALQLKLFPSPRCGHSACRQNWIETGETLCVEKLPVIG